MENYLYNVTYHNDFEKMRGYYMYEEELNKLRKVVPLGIAASYLKINFNTRQITQLPSSIITYAIQNAENNWEFGATGHKSEFLDYNGIIPSDVQIRVYQSKVTGIDKEKNKMLIEPLDTNFKPNTPYMGKLNVCSKFGIFGNIEDTSIINNDSIGVGIPTVGNAKLLTTIDNNGMQEYSIDIIGTLESEMSHIAFNFTDERLYKILGKTGMGGISGSLIVQDRSNGSRMQWRNIKIKPSGFCGRYDERAYKINGVIKKV